MATDPRIRRRRASIARSRKRSVILKLSVVAALVGLVWVVLWSPLLRVSDVRVLGARHTTAAEIARVADLGPDRHVLLLSTDEVARRAETLPWVRTARVDRMLPGTVRVRIVERRPAVVLSLGAARWTLDAGGHVLTAGARGDDLPVVAGVEVAGAQPGEQVDSAEVLAALEALSAMPRGLRARVDGVFAASVERITFSMADGLQVRFGAAEQLRAKYEVLRAVLARLGEEGRTVGYVDVRVPRSPAVGPAASARASEAPPAGEPRSTPSPAAR
ncbi:MAG: cell division protein FtsQ/DivIB [Actinomycetota bacterium]